MRERTQVRAEKVGGRDAEGGEEEDEPEDVAGEEEGPEGGFGAEIFLDVGDGEECIGVRAGILDNRALLWYGER